jgi:hypothetical protein
VSSSQGLGLGGFMKYTPPAPMSGRRGHRRARENTRTGRRGYWRVWIHSSTGTRRPASTSTRPAECPALRIRDVGTSVDLPAEARRENERKGG